MARPPDQAPEQARWGLWIEEVARALTSNLTVKENLAQCWFTLQVPVSPGTGPGIKPVPCLRGRVPYGLSVERVQVLSGGGVNGPVWVHWEPMRLDGVPAIKVLAVYGLIPGTRANLTLLMKAE